MSCIRCLLVAGMALATFLLMANMPITHSKYSKLNKRCGVYFNFSHYSVGTNNFYSNQLNLYNICMNKTAQVIKDRNLTRIEKGNCYTKCLYIFDGFLNEDGTFDARFLEKIREEYTKYSNASVSFINNLVNKFSECPKKVAAIYKDLPNTDKTECRINGLYGDCHDNVTWHHIKNGTKNESCGSQ